MSPESLLQLLWIASPALPVGGYSYSDGLESAVDAHEVHDEASAGDWLLAQLALVVARSELPLLAQAHRAWRAGDARRADALNTWHRTTRETLEARRQSEQMGRSMLDWLRQRRGGDPRVSALAALAPAPAWPLAFALATVAAGCEAREALLAFGFAWCENQVQAAIKSVPLGQGAGQRVLARLVQALPGHVESALALPDDERQSFAPMLAVLSARHESQYSRLFRS